MRKAYWLRRHGPVLLLCVYPVVFNKTALFAPFWLVFMLALSRSFEAGSRSCCRCRCRSPSALIVLFGVTAASLFSVVNFRMVGVPPIAIGVYSDFFTNHELTYTRQC